MRISHDYRRLKSARLKNRRRSMEFPRAPRTKRDPPSGPQHPAPATDDEVSDWPLGRWPDRNGWWDKTWLIGGLEHLLFFPHIGNNHPNWLVFFGGVQTTNQMGCWKNSSGYEGAIEGANLGYPYSRYIPKLNGEPMSYLEFPNHLIVMRSYKQRWRIRGIWIEIIEFR